LQLLTDAHHWTKLIQHTRVVGHASNLLIRTCPLKY